ncbi:hypothetical protein MKZ38_003658 [Zalerion maritima]|uniref:Uncharacterized protein n=1 Tax=Zalerion maritima TaxID=339359 RepID=A0AAD5WS83_9PEZI|nr:hypothetical protein MKZ38_003658 [Zalerion maritima]
MSTAVTERCTIPVKGGVEDWKNQLKQFLQMLRKQDGYLRTRWGPCSEDMQRLELLIGKSLVPSPYLPHTAAPEVTTAVAVGRWESVEACKTWKSSPAFSESFGQMEAVQSGDATSYFLRFQPYAPKEVIGAPIVEVLTYTGCTVLEDQLRAHVEKAKSIAGCTGVASGFSLDKEGVFVAVVGWSGIGASKEADKSLYVTAAGVTPETYHVNFNFPIKGFGGL